MTLAERLSRLDRAQKSRGFQIAASIAIGVLALSLLATALVSGWGTVEIEESAAIAAGAELVLPEDQPDFRDQGVKALELLNGLRSQSSGTTGVLIAIAFGAGVLLLITWIGLLLTYLGLGMGAALAVVPLWLFGAEDLAKFVVGLCTLAASFVAILQGLRLLFSFPTPILAVARNTLSEAVRLKLSVVFIILLMIALPALPGLLDPDSPLRYRVQSFLQYGTGGAFWIIALLTVTFSVATVAFEQRDKVIWQTMTKPVSATQYVFGKWLGVSSLAAALLTVNAAGVFLFTEYLRQQPALGEREAFIAAGEGTAISEDRLILETQVLSAQRKVAVSVPEIAFDRIAQAATQQAVAQVDLDTSIRTNSEREFAIAALQAEIAAEYEKAARSAVMRVERGAAREFVFAGIDQIADPDGTVVMRYQIDSGSNRPDIIYDVSISIGGSPFVVRQTGLGVTHTLPIAPMIVLPNDQIVLLDDPNFQRYSELVAAGRIPGRLFSVEDLLDPDGNLIVTFGNGNIYTGEPNLEWFRFGEDALSLSVSAGSYRANFARVMTVLWLKLALLAMVGIWAATFLSFPVAMLVSMGVFLAAESSPFLGEAVSYFSTTDDDNNPQPLRIVAKQITAGVYWLFSTYGDLRPTARLVTGELLSWGMASTAALFLGLWTSLLGGLAVGIFRKRELATYSGR